MVYLEIKLQNNTNTLRCDMPTKFKFLELIRIQISYQANSLVDSVMCVKTGRGKGKERCLQINYFTESFSNQKKIKFLNG